MLFNFKNYKLLLLLFLFTFLIYGNAYSESFLAKDGYITARNYARLHWQPDALVYRISGTNVNPSSGQSGFWCYYCYSSHTNMTYQVEVNKNNGILVVFNAYQVSGWSNIVKQELEITIIESNVSTQIAENNGGYQYRLANPSAYIGANAMRKNDLPGITQPIWHMSYFIGTTEGFWARIDALTGNLLGTSSGGGGTTVLSQNFESSSFPPSGWNIYYSGTSYWSRSTSCSGYGNGSASAKFSYYSASAGTNQYLYTSVAFSPTQSNFKLLFDHAYATYNSEVDTLRIWSSTNAGNNWAFVSTLLGGTVVGSGMVTAPPIQGDFIPSANQWASKQYSLPYGTNAILFQAISAYGNNLYLDNIKVTNSVDIKKLDELIPVNFSLYQNYPNPFNPSTKIKFELPLNNQVLLKIYNINGQEVETLISQSLNAGVYEVDFDGSKYSSGVYFYTLYTNDFKETKRMILLK